LIFLATTGVSVSFCHSRFTQFVATFSGKPDAAVLVQSVMLHPMLVRIAPCAKFMGDFGSATEAMRIIDIFALQVFAKDLDRGNFRLLQHYRRRVQPIAATHSANFSAGV
jgi:hypothetical protein